MLFIYLFIHLFCLAMLPLPVQVHQFQELMGLSNQADLQADSWGLKRLFSHAVRRWSSGANRPRVLWLAWEHFQFFQTKIKKI